MPAIRWLRRDDALASLVRSHGHEAAPGVEAVSASPQSWLAPPGRPKTEDPHLGHLACHTVRSRHEHAFRAPSIATAATRGEGNPALRRAPSWSWWCHARASGTGVPTIKAPNPTVRDAGAAGSMQGCRLRSCRRTQAPRLGRTPRRPPQAPTRDRELRGNRLLRAYGATAPRGGTRERNTRGGRIASAVCTGRFYPSPRRDLAATVRRRTV
jgi:hypothetical protein